MVFVTSVSNALPQGYCDKIRIGATKMEYEEY